MTGHYVTLQTLCDITRKPNNLAYYFSDVEIKVYIVMDKKQLGRAIRARARRGMWNVSLTSGGHHDKQRTAMDTNKPKARKHNH